MSREERKAAIAAYKERKTVPGVYALRCPAAGRCWVGRAPDVAKIWNRMAFTLRQGGGGPALAEAWRVHGAEGFTFEILERLEDETTPYLRNRWLAERTAHWRAELGAEAV